MSPKARDGKRDYPVFGGEREKFPSYKQMFLLYLRRKKLLGYVMRKDYDPSKSFEFQGVEIPAIEDTRAKDSGPRAEDSGPDGGVTPDSAREEKKKKKASVKAKAIEEQVETCYIVMDSIHTDYHSLVEGMDNAFDMWKAIVDHFGSRDPTDYASMYAAVFRARLQDDENPAMFVRHLDSKVVAFEQVVGIQLGDVFRSLILQHSLPKSWDYIIRGWLGQAKVLQYNKLPELVGTELKKMSEGKGQWPEGKDNGQARGVTEKAYAVVEAQPPRAQDNADQRLCFMCKKPGHLIKHCPENPQKVPRTWSNEGPPAKRQNTGKQRARKEDSELAGVKEDLERLRAEIKGGAGRPDSRGEAWTPGQHQGPARWQGGGDSGRPYDQSGGRPGDGGRPFRGHNYEGDGRGHPPPFQDFHHGGPQQWQGPHGDNVQWRGEQRGPQQWHGPPPPPQRRQSPPRSDERFQERARGRSPPRGRSRDRPRRSQQRRGRSQERRGRSWDRRGGGAPPQRRDSFGSPNFPRQGQGQGQGQGGNSQGGGRPEQGYFTAKVELIENKPVPIYRSKFYETEVELIKARLREKGMACVRRPDGKVDYVFENSRGDPIDEDGEPGVCVITRDDIIDRINKNKKMKKQENVPYVTW